MLVMHPQNFGKNNKGDKMICPHCSKPIDSRVDRQAIPIARDLHKKGYSLMYIQSKEMKDFLTDIFFPLTIIVMGIIILFMFVIGICFLGAGPSSRAYNKLCGSNLTQSEYFWLDPHSNTCMIQYKEKK